MLGVRLALLVAAIVVAAPFGMLTIGRNLGVALLTPVLAARYAGIPMPRAALARAASAAWLFSKVDGSAETRSPDPLLALAQFEAGDVDAAAAEYARGRDDPAWQTLLPSAGYRGAVLTGVLLERGHQPRAAVRSYREGLAAGAGRLEQADYRAFYAALADAVLAEPVSAEGDADALYLAGRWRLLAGEPAAALRLLAAGPPNRSSQRRAAAAYYAGLIEADFGDKSAATEYLSAAAHEDPGFLPACLALESVAERPRQGGCKQTASTRPSQVVDRPVSPGLFLEGVDVDRDTLEAGPLVDTTFLMRAADRPGSDWQSLGASDWLWHGTTLNLAPNAGFEWTAEARSAEDLGYADEFYGRSQDFGTVHPLVRMPRLGGDTQVVGLVHRGVKQSSGLRTHEFVVEPGARYLLAGWQKTDGAVVGIGVAWVGSGQIAYAECPAGAPAAAWRLCTAVITPPPNVHLANLVILNYLTPANVYVDDVMMVRIPI